MNSKATATKERVIRTEWAEKHPLLTKYYDEEWGYPIYSEQGIFERICLETMQSGLSWLTVLKRRDQLREAFAGFDPDIVATFTEADLHEIMQKEGVIKNLAKLRAFVTNARATIQMRDREQNLSELFWSAMPEVSPTPATYNDVPTFSAESTWLAKKLKSNGFVWVGPTTMYAAMGAMGVVDQHIVTSYKRGCSGLWNIDGTRAT